VIPLPPHVADGLHSAGYIQDPLDSANQDAKETRGLAGKSMYLLSIV
jgi:hypothetical protein